MPRKPTRGRGAMKLTGKVGRPKADSESVSSQQNEQKNLPESPGKALKKQKGKRRTPTSLIVIELNDNSAEYILPENLSSVRQEMYGITRQSKNLLFISKKKDLIEKLLHQFTFELETEIIDEKMTKEQEQDQVMEFALKHSTDKIQQENSEFVGTLFNKGDMKHEKRFKFGKVSTIQEFISSLKIPQVNQEETQTPQKISSSPLRKTGDMEIENKELENNLIQTPIQNFDELEANQSENIKNAINSANRIQGQNQSYFTKLKELSAKISLKLAQKFKEIKPKSIVYEQSALSPTTSEDLILSKEERQRLNQKEINFEDVLLRELNKHIQSQEEETPFIALEYGNTCNPAIAEDIKALRFEAQDEMDSHPILKKLKTDEIKNQ